MPRWSKARRALQTLTQSHRLPLWSTKDAPQESFAAADRRLYSPPRHCSISYSGERKQLQQGAIIMCCAPPARCHYHAPSSPSLHSHPCCSDELIDTIFHLPVLSEKERESHTGRPAPLTLRQQHCGHFKRLSVHWGMDTH